MNRRFPLLFALLSFPVLFCAIASARTAEEPAASSAPALSVRIVYPYEGSRIGPVKSSFVFGNVSSPQASLTINGSSVAVYHTGSFIAMIPFNPGPFKIQATALLNGATAQDLRTVLVAEPPATPALLPSKPLTILPDFIQPATDRMLTAGDLLALHFHGTPHGRAEYRFKGLKNPHRDAGWRPMAESSPGVYEENEVIRLEDGAAHAAVEYRLTNRAGKSARLTAPGKIRIAYHNVPLAAEVTADEAVLRTGPADGADTMGYDLFLPKGVRLRANGSINSEVRFKLSDDETGWTDDKNVKILPDYEPLPHTILDTLRAQGRGRRGQVTCGLREKVPYRAALSDDLKTLTLTLYYTVSNLDRMAYVYGDGGDDNLGQVRWKQRDQETVEIVIPARRKIWGYDLRYEGARLVCELIFPPDVSKKKPPLSGLTVAVDPGHSPKPGDGTIGPQGISEGEVNYRIALILKDQLEEAGAKVFLTRRLDEFVDLPERGRRAWQAGADLFVSVHVNALPDGSNPFDRGGFSMYYFQPTSYELARAVHAAYQRSVALRDDGLYYGNLAVCRVTSMPAILTESAYLILPDEEEQLLSRKFQGQVSGAIVEGLSRFVRDYERN